MKYMTTCCCGSCTVKAGTQVLSILSVIQNVIVITLLSVETARLDRGDFTAAAGRWSQTTVTANEVTGSRNGYEWLPGDVAARLHTYLIAVIPIVVFRLLVDLLCVYGALKDRRYLILPYLVFEGLCAGLLAVFLFTLFVAIITVDAAILTSNAEQLLTLLAVVCLKLYYFYVVLSHYKNLVRGDHGSQPAVSYSGEPLPPCEMKI